MTDSGSGKSSPENCKSISTSTSESSSDSTASTSPPSTPPSPDRDQPPEYIQHEDQPVPGFPRVHRVPHSAIPPRRGNRRGNVRTSTSTRLGAIDEHSNAVAPDIPKRNPNRNIPGFNSKHNFFNFAAYSRSDKADVPPVNAYDNIVGPNGEKFRDLRSNSHFSPSGRGSWKRLLCLGLIVLVVTVIALGVGLGVGLTRRKGTRYLSHLYTSCCYLHVMLCSLLRDQRFLFRSAASYALSAECIKPFVTLPKRVVLGIILQETC